ncbi:N-acetylmannosamine kinase [subsurface metagenome]|nr:ROK family protein [Clostridia bacterium]
MTTKKLKFYNTVSSKMQNEINKSIVFNYLRENKSISRAKVARDLKISAPTVSKIVDELIRECYLIEIGKDESTGGKRPIQLKFNSDIGCVIGVDLGKDKVRIARCDFGGNILEKHVGFKIFYKDKKLQNKIIKEIELFIDKANLNDSKKKKKIPLKAICLGVPADIDIDTGEIKSAALFEGWEGLKLKEILTEKFNLPIYIENSTNVSAMGDNYYGEGKRFSDIVFLEVSEGIGAGIIIDNQIFRGSYSSAGEVGFIVAGTKNLYSTYKNKGYMEEIVSPGSIEKEVVKAIKNGKKTLIKEIVSGDLAKINSSIVCKAASLGDSLACEILKKVVEHLAIIVINLTLILNPQIIIVGGDICALPEVNNLFIDPLKNIAKRVIPFKLPEIKLSLLGEDGGIIGASFYAIDNLLTKDFPYRIKKEEVPKKEKSVSRLVN